MKMVNVGFGNALSAERVVAVISAEAAPTKRMIQAARDSGKAIDATAGRKTRTVVVTDSGHIVLSALQPETITARLDQEDAIDPRRTP